MKLLELIHKEIVQSGGFLPFDRYMQLALYAPGLGYYSSGVPMAGSSGDFTTAPEMTPLFGRTIARQLAQLFEAGAAPTILEFGAGTGKLARDVLEGLAELGFADVRYQILDVSGSLRSVQQQALQAFGTRVQWLDALPAQFEGVMLGNEVLDAMPCSVFALRDGKVFERGVTFAGEQLQWSEREASAELKHAISMRVLEQKWPEMPVDIAYTPSGYVSEINLQAEAFMRTLASTLTRGAVLMIDYGFPRREYYHPQRDRGTLMCHAQQRVHDDPLHAPGHEDITAHVDFTAVRDAALEGGLQLAGYTGQARFLINCGLLDLAAQLPQHDALAYAKAVAPLQKLLSEAEMGELFKVIGFARGIDLDWVGFARGDRSGGL
ncbi:MAG: class I SAM-dependent methyltransferase [Burkholderiaceae bacterium]